MEGRPHIMENRPTLRHVAPLAVLLLGLVSPSCSSIAQSVSGLFGSGDPESETLRRVNDLHDRIERVHVETELSMESMHTALRSLEGMVSPAFQGDALSAFGELERALESSEDQARTLASAVKAMQDSASAVFDPWAADLERFSNAEMRRRSQLRLEATHQRYEAIAAAVKPALWQYSAVNSALRDCIVFLGFDLNSASLGAIRDDLAALQREAAELDLEFEATLDAAEDYLRSAALPGGPGEGAAGTAAQG